MTIELIKRIFCKHNFQPFLAMRSMLGDKVYVTYECKNCGFKISRVRKSYLKKGV